MREYYDEMQKKKPPRCYKMESHTRGLGIVITMTGARDGWKSDVLQLEKMFRYLHIDTEYHFDLSRGEMEDKLTVFAENRMNSGVDCLFVVVMGHGGIWNEKEYMKTTDGGVFPVKDKIKEIFNNHKYPQLIDKPKVIIVQMCRGANANEPLDHKGRKVATDEDASRHVGEFSDYIFGFATQSGIVSYRSPSSNSEPGSWYIQHLTDVFIDNAHLMPVDEMLGQVNQRLEVNAFQLKTGAQIGERITALKYPLYLCPGMPPKE